METEWIDSNTAAEMLGITRHYLVELARAGRIRCIRRAGRVSDGKSRQWYFDPGDLQRFKENPRPMPEGERDYVSIGEAAESIGRSIDSLRHYRDAGWIEWVAPEDVPKEQRVFRVRWYVRRSDVQRLVEEGRLGFPQLPLPTLDIGRDDLIWFAGFFDGEGCVSIHKPKNAWVVRIRIGSTAIDCIRFMHETYGGALSFRGRLQPHYLDQAIWTAHGDHALALLLAVRPFLRVKGPVADLAIEMQQRIRACHYAWWHPMSEVEKEWRTEQVEKLRKLNCPNRRHKG